MRKTTVRPLGSTWGLQGIATLALGVSACAPHPASLTGSLQANGRSALCELLAPPSVAAPSLRIAVTDAITASDAPLARTDAERVIFPLLYVPPSGGVTCHGPSGSMRVESAAASQSAATTVLPAGSPGPVTVWPATTGRYEIATAIDTALDLVPRRSTPGPVLHVSRIRSDGGRDALDGGTDVLITFDATTIAYAAARPDFISVPLPWSRVYVLIQPHTPVHVDPDTARSLETDLAGDAVRVEARAVDDSEWRDVLATCDTGASTRPVASADSSAPPPAPRVALSASPFVNWIVYVEDDNVARALSERLVALANARDPRMTAVAPAVTTGEPRVLPASIRRVFASVSRSDAMQPM